MPKIEPKTTRRRAALRAEDDAHRQPRQRVREPADLPADPAGLTGPVERHHLARIAVERRAARGGAAGPPRRRACRCESRARCPRRRDRGRAPPRRRPGRSAGPARRRGAWRRTTYAWPLNGSSGMSAGSRPDGAQHGEQRVAPSRQAPVVAPRAADADVDEVLLGEEPAVAAQVGLHVDLGRVHEAARAAPRHSGGRRVSLSWRDHDLLARGDLAEVARHRTAVAARADHQGRLEVALLGLDARTRPAPALTALTRTPQRTSAPAAAARSSR